MPKVLVVGGEPAFVAGTFSQKLRDVGIEVGWHHESDLTRFPGIPDACEGVVIMKNVSHRLSDPAKAEAKARKLPYPAVSRKWHLAEPVLRMHGLLPPACNGQIQPGTDDVVLPLATDYVREQREGGRYPKQDEVQAVLQRVFGPSYRLSEDLFKQVMAATAGVIPDIPEEDTPSPLPESLTPLPDLMSEEDCRAAVRMVLEAAPAASVVQTTAAVDELSAGKPDIRIIREEWWKVRKERQDMEREERDKAIKQWLLGVFEQVKQGQQDLPSQDVLNKGCSEHFKINAPWPIVKEARAEVFGDWALELVLVPVAERYFARKAPGGANLATLIEEGRIPSIKSGQRKYTSEKAIDDYVSSLQPAPPATPEEEQQPMNEKDVREIKERLGRIEANQIEMEKRILAAFQAFNESLKDLPSNEKADEILTLLRGLASANGTPPKDSLLQLVQGGQVRVVIEPIPSKG